jgi:large subunit ribosomal protein L9
METAPHFAPVPGPKDSAMASRRIDLLLNRTVEHLGLVGDVVRVRAGYARNYLLPMGLAEPPTPEKVEALKEARAAAQAEQAAVRAARAETIERLSDITVRLVRSCNDQGALYGSVTQRDISDALVELGYNVDMRAVRLSQPIRRLGENLVLIQFERDLKQEITVRIVPDREIEGEREEEAAPTEGEAEGVEPAAEPAASE